MPKSVTADPEVEATATAEEPPKKAKTLRLSLKSKAPAAVETADEVAAEAPEAAVAEDQPETTSAAAAVEPVEEGPVLSPAERREAILRRLREEGDTTVPPRRAASDNGAPPPFRYPVNRFAR